MKKSLLLAMALSLASVSFAAETEAPSAVLTFDGTKDAVTIGFRIAQGSIKIVAGSSEAEYTAGKTVEVPLSEGNEVKIYGSGLQSLNINGQGMTAIDVANAPKLQLLQVENNALTSIDLSANPLVTGIYADNNQVNSIDLSKNTAMRVVNMADNKLSGKLDMSALSNLYSFNLNNNELTEIALPSGTPLYELCCENNSLTAIDMAGCSELQEVRLTGNKLTSLDLTGLNKLEDLNASENKLTEVKGLADCPELSDLYLQNNSIEALDISANTKISWMNVENNHIPVLDVSKLTNLRLLYAANNEIESIDLTNAPYCGQITLSNNKLTSIDVSAQTSMIKLYVSGNNLSALDLTKNGYLWYLECGDNNIESINVTNCPYLRQLYIENNRLTELDITANPEICGINISGNNMDSDAINDIIASLPDITGEEPAPGSEFKTVFNISDMPGTKDADIAAAEAKGWNVEANVTPVALTQEQLDKFRPLVNNDAVTGEFKFNSAVQVNYPDASNPNTIIFENFDGNGSQLRASVNWEDGTISVAPYTVSSDIDYETNEYYSIMLVNSEAANLSSPMDKAFSSSKVTGTIDENKITLNDWCLVRVNHDSSEMTKISEPVNTTVYIPNATMTLNTYEWDDDWENLLPTAEPVVIDVYTEASDNTFTVYGWNDTPSKVTFDLAPENGKYVFTTPEDETIYTHSRKNKVYERGIAPLTGTTWDDVAEITRTSFSSMPVESKTELNFGPWIIMEYVNGSTEGTEVVMGSAAKIALNYELPIDMSGIEGVGIDEEPVKVTYYNLQGVQVANPEKGIYVKVSTYGNGTTKSVKVVK